MKRIRILVAVAVATMAVGITSVVHAQLPNNSIIIGNSAYSVGYLQNHADVVNQQIMNNLNSLYYVDNSGNAKDIFSGASVSESQVINNIGKTLTSYDANGTTTQYTADMNNQFQTSGSGTSTYYATIDATYNYVSTTAGLRIVNLKVRNISGVKDATYFVIGDSTPTTDNLTSINNQVTFFSSNSDLYPDKMITIYDSNRSPIYYGTVRINYDVTKTSYTGTVNLGVTANNNQSSVNTQGNLPGNVTNTGLAAIDSNEKWIYYINTSDKNKLYKRSVDGIDDIVVSDDSVNNINIVGNWIYYCNYSDAGKIYKVKVDGTGRQKVTDDKASCMNVIGDNIYYINHSDSGKVYIINSSGKKALSNDSAEYMNAIGSTIFYSNSSIGKKLYKISYNPASTGTPIITKLGDIPANYINAISESVVYYTSSDSKLYRLNGSASFPINVITNIPVKGKTGSSTVKSVSDKMTDICVDSQGNIYYKSYADGGKLYKLDSTFNGYKVVDDIADFINVIDSSADANNVNKGYIYYLKSGKLNRVPIDTDGTLKPEAIGKSKSTLKIKTLSTIPTVTTSDINSFSFPEKISAIMSDNTMQELVVNWDKANGKFVKGVYTYTGTVLGYGNKVTLNVSIASPMPTNVVVKNDVGSKDVVTVSGLLQGDIVSVYTSQDQTKPVKTAVATASGVGNVTGLNLNANGGTIYVTVTTAGKAESGKLAVLYPAEAPVSFAVNAQNNTVTALKANQKYTFYMYDASIVDDTKVDWNNDGTTGLTKPISLSVTSDASGTVDLTQYQYGGVAATFDGIITANGGKDMAFRIKQSGDTSATNSLPSTMITITKAKIPDYVAIDYSTGVINGTTTDMQYTYIDPSSAGFDQSQWKACTSGMTPISLNMNLQLWLRIKPNGPVLASKAKPYALFAPPVVTGIKDGSIYSTDNQATPTWTVPNNTDGNVSTSVSARIAVYNSTEQDDNNWTSVNGFTNLVSGNAIDPTVLLSKDASFNANTVFAFILSETKTVNGKTGTAKVIIKFTVNSNKPAQVDIAINEPKGTINAIDTYYTAKPDWTSFAGTSDQVSLYRLSTIPSATTSAPTNPSTDTTFNGAAAIDFIKGNTITQAGYYRLGVTTTNRENGAKTATYKYFIIDKTDVTPVSIYVNTSLIIPGSIYKVANITSQASVTDRTVSAQIMGDSGFYRKYNFGTDITVDGNYTLKVTTTNNINGAFSDKLYQFVVSNDAVISAAPNLKLDASSGKFVLTPPGASDTRDMTLMQYSIDGGSSWNNITSSTSFTIPDITASHINTTNGVRVKVKAYGSNTESAQQLISVQKQPTPTGITFAFATTATTTDSTTAQFTGITTANNYEYSVDGGNVWTTLTSNNFDAPTTKTLITSLLTNNMDVKIRQKSGGNGTGVLIASDPISMSVWKPTPLTGITFVYDATNIATPGSLTGTDASMEYSIDGGVTWKDATTVTFNPTDLSSLTATNGIQVRAKANGAKMPSDNYKITVAAAPNVTFATPDTTGSVKLSGTSATMEYQKNGGTWTTCASASGDEIVASIGDIINVRTIAANGQPASEIKALTVAAANIGSASVPNAIFVAPVTTGKVKLSGTDSTMEYQQNGAASWTTCAGGDEITANIGDTINVRIKATGSQPASAAKTLTVAASNIGPALAPSGITSSAASTTSGNTIFNNVTDSVVYEYVFDNNGTLAGTASGWSSAASFTASGTTQELSAAGKTNFHIRIKATSTQPASAVCDGTVTAK